MADDVKSDIVSDGVVVCEFLVPGQLTRALSPNKRPAGRDRLVEHQL